jgi:hypothetical protein
VCGRKVGREGEGWRKGQTCHEGIRGEKGRCKKRRKRDNNPEASKRVKSECYIKTCGEKKKGRDANRNSHDNIYEHYKYNHHPLPHVDPSCAHTRIPVAVIAPIHAPKYVKMWWNASLCVGSCSAKSPTAVKVAARPTCKGGGEGKAANEREMGVRGRKNSGRA